MRVPTIENYSKAGEIMHLKMMRPAPIERDYLLVNDKDRIKFIKTVEQIVRSSHEYRQYIDYLKKAIDMSMCAFFNNINANTRIKIEIHHEPFTLFDITNIVVGDFIEREKPLNPLIIAREVMKLHYANKVGLIPLSTTCHSLYHDGRLMIPLQCVYGDYLAFIDEYYDIIHNLPDLESALAAKISMSKELQTVDTSILNKKYVYLDIDGFRLPSVIE